MNLITKHKTMKLLSSPKYTILDIIEQSDVYHNEVLRVSVEHNRTNAKYHVIVNIHEDLQSTKQWIHTRGLI